MSRTEVRKQLPIAACVVVVLVSDGGRDGVLAELGSCGPMAIRSRYLLAEARLGRLGMTQAHHRSKGRSKGLALVSAREGCLRETERFEIDPVIDRSIRRSSHGGRGGTGVRDLAAMR